MSERSVLIEKLEEFISKYYKNLLLKGGIYFVSVFLLFFILFSTIEYFGQFNTSVRAGLFWSFSLINALVFWKWVAIPLKGLYRLGKSLSHYDAAKIIGEHFSNVEDKLINLLQLQELSSKDNALIEASIEQKIKWLKPIPFSTAINLKANTVYLKYAIVPIGILCLLFLSGNKEVVVDSSARILSFNTEFVPEAPFDFIIDNTYLEAVKGNDFLLEMHFSGEELPKNSAIVIDKNRYEMRQTKTGHFSFLFKNTQKTQSFRFEANGFKSALNTLRVIPKPSVNKFSVSLKYPSYTKRKNETKENVGNLQVPQGTRVKWSIIAQESENVYLRFDKNIACKQIGENEFEHEKSILKNTKYTLVAQNNYLLGDSIVYEINAIPDAYPAIDVQETIDSVNTMQRFFEGYIEDDYGIKELLYKYRFLTDTSSWVSQSVNLNATSNRQGFTHSVDFKDLGLDFGVGVEYFFEVWDNDGINGSKSSKSSLFNYQAASIDELEAIAEEENNQLKNDLQESKKLADEIQKDLEKLQKQLLKDKELSWEDKQKTKELLEKQELLKNKVNEIQRQQKQNQLSENLYQKPNEELLKKQEEIQRLFDSIMNEEMQEMMQELNKMMNSIDKEELQKMLEDMQQSDEDIEKELDRTLELFKQMELQQKLEKNIDELQKLAEKQRQLAEESNKGEKDKESLNKKQEELNKEFEDIQKELEKAKELNKDLENKQDIPDTKTKEEQIKEDMQKSAEQLQINMKKQASKNQKKAANKMEEMSQSLQTALQQAQAEGLAEDMQTLRQILENLITLSLDQENILISIGSINLNSPVYLDYLQLQNKLQSDAQIIEDSLFALSKRQPQIQSIVNSEINAINNSMENALLEMAERRSSKASERQQFAMTAANNLALILSEVLEQMQKDMANMDSKPGDKMCNKPNKSGGQGMKEMKKMQQQIQEQMKSMMKGKKGKNGKSSKGLAQLAAQQEMIRQRMGEIREELSGDKNAKDNIDQMMKKMEENEVDIINDQITRETLLRQESIMSRLLEAEKAQRERDQDKKRQSTEWMDMLSKRLINPFEDYQKEKEKQEELLRTIPPSFTPFYKNKVKDYFKENGN
jgi:hypothetical protein